MRKAPLLVGLAVVACGLASVFVARGRGGAELPPVGPRPPRPHPPVDAWLRELADRRVPCDYSLAGVDCGLGWRDPSWYERVPVAPDPVSRSALSPCAGSRYQHTRGPYCGDEGLAFDPSADQKEGYVSQFDLLGGAPLPEACPPPNIDTPEGTCIWASSQGDVTGDGRPDTVMVIGPEYRRERGGVFRHNDMPRAVLAAWPSVRGAPVCLSGWIGYSPALPPAGSEGCDRLGVWLVDLDRDGAREIVLAEERIGANVCHSALIAFRVRGEAIQRLDEVGSIYWLMAEDYDCDGLVEVVAPGGRYQDGQAWQFRDGHFRSVRYPEAITERAMAEFANDRCLDGIALGLSGYRPTDAQLAYLADQTGLKGLILSEARVTDAGLVHLAKLVNLETLDLTGTRVTGSGFGSLAELHKLEDLQLTGTPVTDDGLEALRFLPQLRTLRLDHTRVTDAGLRHLAPLASLETLGLCETQVGDAGLSDLCALRSLDTLWLSDTQISDAGLRSLEVLTNLRVLSIGGGGVTGPGLARLRAALPWCEIRH